MQLGQLLLDRGEERMVRGELLPQLGPLDLQLGCHLLDLDGSVDGGLGLERNVDRAVLGTELVQCRF